MSSQRNLQCYPYGIAAFLPRLQIPQCSRPLVPVIVGWSLLPFAIT